MDQTTNNDTDQKPDNDNEQKSNNDNERKPYNDNQQKPVNGIEKISGNDKQQKPDNDMEQKPDNDIEQTSDNDTRQNDIDNQLKPDSDNQPKPDNDMEQMFDNDTGHKPDGDKQQKSDNDKEHNTCNNRGSFIKENFLGFLKAFVRLAKNPIFVCVTVAICTADLRTFGIIPFIFKYITEMYALNNAQGGGIVAGLVTCGALGSVLGGALVRIFKLNIVGMLRLTVIVSCLGCLFSLGLLLKCPDIKLAGLEVPYANETGVASGYNATCNMNCNCDKMRFNSVCGIDGIVYYSGCHAGCLTPPSNERVHIQTTADVCRTFMSLLILFIMPVLSLLYQEPYTNCSCVASSLNKTVNDDVTASPGRCEDGCSQVKFFIPLLYLMASCGTAVMTPVSMISIRCVDEDLRPFAMGVFMVLIRLLGQIPGPVLFGAIIDSSCVIWTGESCDSSGVCSMYNKSQLSRGTWLFYFILSVISTVFLVIGSIIASRKAAREDSYSPETEDVPVAGEEPQGLHVGAV